MLLQLLMYCFLCCNCANIINVYDTHTPKYTRECAPQPHHLHHPALSFDIVAAIHDSKKKISYLLLTSKDDDAVCVCVCTAPATTVALCTLCLLLSNI